VAMYTQPIQSSRWLRKHKQYSIVDGYVYTTTNI